MISICIPVYNFNIAPLLETLAKQAERLPGKFEIIIIDDASDALCRQANSRVCEGYRYIELRENTGRAKIRNLFLNHARHDYLLFLDCDSLVSSGHFLSTYLELLQEQPDVVCGGRVYPERAPGRNKRLRWKYGIYRESKPAAVRRQSPNRSFMTNNFMIRKSILEKIRFDERLTQYGHEDTLFGYALKKNNISITHVENPVVNGDLEDNEEYLEKTRNGVRNLVHIINFTGEEAKDLYAEIDMLRFYQKVRPFEPLIKAAFFLSKPLILFLLKSGRVNLFLFDFYKLGLFMEIKRA